RGDESLERSMKQNISRRRMIQLTAAAMLASAGCVAQRPAKVTRDEFTIAFLSDTHLGKDGNDQALEQMKQAGAEINASNAAMTIMGGDLVHGGQDPKVEKHYPAWFELANAFKRPWVAVPGNHDPDAIFLKHIQKQTDFAVTQGAFVFVCFRDAIGNPN